MMCNLPPQSLSYDVSLFCGFTRDVKRLVLMDGLVLWVVILFGKLDALVSLLLRDQIQMSLTMVRNLLIWWSL
jgi:hypothetical protein